MVKCCIRGTEVFAAKAAYSRANSHAVYGRERLKKTKKGCLKSFMRETMPR